MRSVVNYPLRLRIRVRLHLFPINARSLLIYRMDAAPVAIPRKFRALIYEPHPFNQSWHMRGPCLPLILSVLVFSTSRLREFRVVQETKSIQMYLAVPKIFQRVQQPHETRAEPEVRTVFVTSKGCPRPY